MSEEQLTDDQSHYEVSLTAGQAFVAFVFLLLSLAAAFAFADLDSDFRLPDEIAVRLAAGPWYFTVFRVSDGRPLETRVWEKPS